MRMIRILAVLIAMSSVAAAQGGTQQTSKISPGAEKKQAAPAAKGSADGNQAVITIENLCPARQPKPTPCRTVITKDDFEGLISVIGANLPPARRVQVANRYAEMLTFADQAQKAGLDKTPEFQEEMEQQRRQLREETRLRRLQSLALAYDRHLRAKYGKVPDAEVEKYYNENKAAYEEVTLKRVYVRRVRAQGDKKPALDEAATKALAEKIRERAAAGEDLDKLQQEATAAVTPEAAKMPAAPTSMGARRRGALPPDQEAQIFNLSAGQVSPVFEELPGFFIYKVESKRVVPLEELKTQLVRQLEEQKVKDAIEHTLGLVKTTIDENYFKPPEPAKAPAAAPTPPAAPPAPAGGEKGAAKEAPPPATPPSPPQQATPPPGGAAPSAPPK